MNLFDPVSESPLWGVGLRPTGHLPAPCCESIGARRLSRRALCAVGLTLVSTLLMSGVARAGNRRMSPIVRAVAKARPAVVSIQGRKHVRGNSSLVGTTQGRQIKGMGTGVIIDPRGYILTNFHVVDGVDNIEVTTSDRKVARARLIARDRETDLAIIRVDTKGPLPVIPIGTSVDLMQGETVIAVGNAYGYDFTVTTGVISALHRPVQISDTQQYKDLIQTDASINPGNSGGPLLNIEGDMIGVNVAVRVGAQGIGFAIPVNAAVEAASKLLSIESIDRNTHGIVGHSVDDGEASHFEVSALTKNGPAARAGLAVGDVVRSIDDHDIRNALDVELALLGRKANEEISVVVDRQGKRLQLSLILSRSQGAPATYNLSARLWQLIGIRVEPVSPRVIRQINAGYSGGLRIMAVRPGSLAAQEGLRRGDILVGLHKWETASMENIDFILNSEAFLKTQPSKFFILRGTRTLYGWFDVSSHFGR